VNAAPAAKICGHNSSVAAMSSESSTTQATSRLDRRLSVAPMMDWTDRHERYFLRRISRHTLLYTEMITTGAILYGDRDRFLRFNQAEHPVALQLGGCDPVALAECAAIGEQFGYDEINLNVGCPSDRVQAARFGACLMAEAPLVADCVSAMQKACALPVTVKCRIGIDEQDSYGFFADFIERVAEAGCRVFTVHARKAWLQGLSPKQNREIPPLHYDFVYRLKENRPDLQIIINGGIETLEQAEKHLQYVDGVMLGRAAYKNPYLLAEADRRIFGDKRPAPGREAIALSMREYIEQEMSKGVPFKRISRHMLGLFQGQYGGRLWRRILSEQGHKPEAGINSLLMALEATHKPAEEAA